MQNGRLIRRREFLTIIAGGGLGVLQGRGTALDPLGLQLYTVRSNLEREFDQTLERVAGMGYREVEFVGYFGRSPQQVRAALKANGLVGISAHSFWNMLGDRWKEVVDTAHQIGHEHLVINSMGPPVPPAETGVWTRGADLLNKAGEVCRSARIRLAYHNHLSEFAPIPGTSERPYDVLVRATDPALVAMQMDLCWAIAAGQDPAQQLARHPNRYLSVHVKDLKRLPVKRADGSTPSLPTLFPDLCSVGQGVLDWPELIRACRRAGIRHYFVEQDQAPLPMDAAAASAKYLRSLRIS
jgi:sugar phosphate isomerase/epimerase